MMNHIGLPLVTVYITNYNYEQFIRQAIESVLKQTMTDYELIIIDDGSTDNSKAIIMEYSDRPGIRVVMQQNKGLNATNNVALRLSRGKYIMRLDADDFLSPDALLVMVSRLEANPLLGLVFPDYYYVDKTGNIFGQERRHDFSNSVSLLDQPAHGACTMIRKNFLLGIGGYNEKLTCQDGYDLWLRFIEKHDVENVNLPLFYYRRHGTNLTEDNERLLRARAKLKEMHAEKAKKPKLKVLGLILVRGRQIDSGCQSLQPLGDKALLDWTIDAALEAQSLTEVIVSTSDTDITEHVASSYGEQVKLHRRTRELSLETVQFSTVLDNVLQTTEALEDFDAVMILSADCPFKGAMYIDKAVNTMRIFEVDTVNGVTVVGDRYYQHDGHGLRPVGIDVSQDSFRKESEYLYKSTRGFLLVSMKHFKTTGLCNGGKVGHITMDSHSAFNANSPTMLAVANFLLENGLKM